MVDVLYRGMGSERERKEVQRKIKLPFSVP
jgi:hypothetical protein